MSGLDMPKCVVDHDHEADEGHCVYEDWTDHQPTETPPPLTARPWHFEIRERDAAVRRLPRWGSQPVGLAANEAERDRRWLLALIDAYEVAAARALPASSSALGEALRAILLEAEEVIEYQHGTPSGALDAIAARARAALAITGPATEEPKPWHDGMTLVTHPDGTRCWHREPDWRKEVAENDEDVLYRLTCGCGDPDAALSLVYDVLQWAANRLSPSWTAEGDKARIEAILPDERARWAILYWLDDLNLMEHGTVVPGWPTDKGYEMLALLANRFANSETTGLTERDHLPSPEKENR